MTIPLEKRQMKIFKNVYILIEVKFVFFLFFFWKKYIFLKKILEKVFLPLAPKSLLT